MAEQPFKPGDTVRLISTAAYRLVPGSIFVVTVIEDDLVIFYDSDGDRRFLPAHFFELVAAAPEPAPKNEWVNHLNAPYGGQGLAQAVDPYTETANRALAARVRQLEEALRPFLFKPADFIGKTIEGYKVPDLLADALDETDDVVMRWPTIRGVQWESYVTIRDLRRVREVMGND